MTRFVKNKGVDLRINGQCTIFDSHNLIVGDHVRIGSNCFFFCKGGVRIGDNVQLSRNITIYSANHNYKGNAIPYDDTYVEKSVVIGDNVWVGMGVQILPGVTIGEGAIIGMGTVVYKDVEPFEIVVNRSMITIRKRERESYEKLKKANQWFGKVYPDK